MPKHYKAWQQCLLWTLIIFTSLFVVARVDITVGGLVTIFSAYVLSGKADIGDMYMYLVYKRRFREHKSFEEIREELDLENPRINEILDKVYTLMTFNLKL